MVRLCSGQQLAGQFGLQPLDPGQVISGSGGASLDALTDDQKSLFAQDTKLAPLLISSGRRPAHQDRDHERGAGANSTWPSAT